MPSSPCDAGPLGGWVYLGFLGPDRLHVGAFRHDGVVEVAVVGTELAPGLLLTEIASDHAAIRSGERTHCIPLSGTASPYSGQAAAGR